MVIQKGKYVRLFKGIKDFFCYKNALPGICYEIKGQEMSDFVDRLVEEGKAERRSKKFVVCSGVVVEKNDAAKAVVNNVQTKAATVKVAQKSTTTSSEAKSPLVKVSEAKTATKKSKKRR